MLTFVMWLLVATTEIHFQTCFCAICQDLRLPFFQDFFWPTLLCMPFAANIAVVIVAAIMIAFLYLHASDVHQHTFNRSRVATLL